MGTSGDKIVLLDGMGSGSGSAANGLLSMIPGMFTSLLGGNKMDPNLVAALMNGRNNQDQFGGANGWWLWIIVLFWLWGGRGFGNGFGGNGNDCCANGLPAQLNNDYGRELLMQAIQGNRSAIDQISNALNCSTSQLQNAICNVQGAIMMMRSTTAEAVGDAHAAPTALIWVTMVAYMIITVRNVTG